MFVYLVAMTYMMSSSTGAHKPWKPRSMKCCAHCTFSAPIFWITYRFWNVCESHRLICDIECNFVIMPLFINLQCAVLTCRGCIPEAMRSLIIRTCARLTGSAGRSRGPGLVSSRYWITASCGSKQIFRRVDSIRFCRMMQLGSIPTHWLRKGDAINLHCWHLLHGI